MLRNRKSLSAALFALAVAGIGAGMSLADVGIAMAQAAPAVPAAPADAAPVTPSHLAAAREAVAVTKSNRGLEALLPMTADQAQARMLRARPDLYKQLPDAVDAAASKMASRRNDLEADIARVWAKYFTEAELKQIVAFYKTPAGAKIAESGQQISTEVAQAVKGWTDRLGDEMTSRTKEELKKTGVDF